MRDGSGPFASISRSKVTDDISAFAGEGLRAYLSMMEPVTPVFHIAYLVFLFRLALYGNKFRAPFNWFVTLHLSIFLFLPFGWIIKESAGGPSFKMRAIAREGIPLWLSGSGFPFSAASLILTLVLLYAWFDEARRGENDYDFRKIPWHRWWAVLLILWGFLYPLYPADNLQGYEWMGAEAFWRSPFGVLPAPTSIFLLGLLTLIYPRVNRRLFLLFNGAFLLLALAAPPSPDRYPLLAVAAYNLAATTAMVWFKTTV